MIQSIFFFVLVSFSCQSYLKAPVGPALSLIYAFTASVERKANEELQELMADQVNQVMKVRQVPWELEDWRENRDFLDHQGPEDYL